MIENILWGFAIVIVLVIATVVAIHNIGNEMYRREKDEDDRRLP